MSNNTLIFVCDWISTDFIAVWYEHVKRHNTSFCIMVPVISIRVTGSNSCQYSCMGIILYFILFYWACSPSVSFCEFSIGCVSYGVNYWRFNLFMFVFVFVDRQFTETNIDSLHVYLGNLLRWGGLIESNLSDLTEHQIRHLDRVICRVKQMKPWV